MSALSLRKVEELHSSTKSHPSVYKGCLSATERQLMVEIYGEAKLREVKVTSKNASAKFRKYRKEWL